MDDIARHAGVGVGTLYRHFPTKEALIAAIVGERIATVTAMAKARERDAKAGAAFFAVLDRMWTEGAKKRDLVDALAGVGFDVRSAISDQSAALRKALGKLLRRAQAEGAIRPDVTIEAVLALVAACNAARPGKSADKVFAVLRDGLRPVR